MKGLEEVEKTGRRWMQFALLPKIIRCTVVVDHSRMLQGIVDCKTTTLSYDTENGTTLITNLRKFFNKITGVDELKMNQKFQYI